MTIKDIANNTILKPDFKDSITFYDGNTDDIIRQIVRTHPKSVLTVAEFSKHLAGKNTAETLLNIHRFIRTFIKYKLDTEGTQKIKTASRTWYDKFGDCKSYSIFTASILQNLGIPFSYRFVSYSSSDQPTHVYVIVGNTVIDCCLPKCGDEKKYTFKKDLSMTQISELSGPPGRKGNPFKKALNYTPQMMLVNAVRRGLRAKRAKKLRAKKGNYSIITNPKTGFNRGLSHGELALRIAKRRTQIEKNIVAGIAGPNSMWVERYNNRIDVLNDAIAAIQGPNPELEMDYIIADVQNGVYHSLSAEVAGIGDIGKKKAKREEKNAERKAKRDAKVKSGKKPLLKKLKTAGQKFLKKAGTLAKKALKVVTAPQRLLVKGILEVALPKISNLFLYLFITDPNVIAKLPKKVKKSRDKALKLRNFIVNKIGMKEGHFMGIVRNGIMKKYKMSPENLITKAMTGKVSGLYSVNGLSGIGCTKCNCPKIAGPMSFVPSPGNNWYTSKEYKMFGPIDVIGADPYTELINIAVQLIQKLIKAFGGKKGDDVIPTKDEIPDPSNQFDVEPGDTPVSKEELANDIKKQESDNLIVEDSSKSSESSSSTPESWDNMSNDSKGGITKEENDKDYTNPKNGGSNSKGWS